MGIKHYRYLCYTTGRHAAEVPGGREKASGNHQSFPEHSSGHPGPNRAPQQPQQQAVPGEQRVGQQAHIHHPAV